MIRFPDGLMASGIGSIGNADKAKLHEAMLYEKAEKPPGKKAVNCRLCSHYCVICDGNLGFCSVRANLGGKLYSLSYGKATGMAMDPVEKKPFFHYKPGTQCLSFGTPGCNMRCLNCQNWFMSQGPREAKTAMEAFGFKETPPKKIAQLAVEYKADGVAYTYSEPAIFFEYARDTIKETKKIAPEKYHVFVSNGYFSKECFGAIKKEKLLDAIRIDLKFFNDKKYRQVTGAGLEPVLESIKRVHASPMHLEVICLVIPTLSDDPDELREMCKWLARLDKELPVHFIRFFPCYKLGNLPPTPEETLLKAKAIAEEEGLQYVYAGNTEMPGVENTKCPKCGTLLIERYGMGVIKNVWGASPAKERKSPSCPACGHKISIVL